MPDTVTALAELGATPTTLTPAQSDQLDQFGYLPLPGILDGVALESLRARCDELSAAEAERAGLEAHQEKGTARLANLVDKDRIFDRCWNHPAQLAAVAHVLDWQELKLMSLNGRAALPGQGHQRLHADWADCGCTRLLSGMQLHLAA